MPVLRGHFEGERIVLDDPVPAGMSGPVQIYVPSDSEGAPLSEEWTRLSQEAFGRLWDNPEDNVYNELLDR